MGGLGHGHGHQHENITIDWDSIKWDELTPEEKWNYEHLRMHQKHAGHAEMHAEMILILLVVLVVSQVGKTLCTPHDCDFLLTRHFLRLSSFSGRSEDLHLTISAHW